MVFYFLIGALIVIVALNLSEAGDTRRNKR